jgi:RNA polymerase sigma-70 factor (ECF subfamily)
MPADQVASHMNCSMATVRSHIANARIKFKRYLEAKKSS